MGKLRKRSALLESVPVLVLLGLLAGAVGGLGIGLIQLRQLRLPLAQPANRLIPPESIHAPIPWRT